MSNIINQNLDEIISIKNQLSNVLIENGVEAGNRFSDYPDMFRSVIASGGGSIDEETLYSYIGDYLDSYNFIDQDSLSANSYATQSYVMDKIGAIPSVDLSSYVTHTELNNAGYITTEYISTNDIVPSTNEFYHLGNATYRYLQIATKYAFVTDELAFGTQKITHQDTAHSLTVVTNTFDRIIFNDNGIIPAESATYTLGDADHLYARTYTDAIQSGSGGLVFRVGSSNTVTIGGGDMRPSTNGAQSLGRSSNKWNNAYISNLYADTIHNFIWTGTSAEYAALDNYTTYQIYLIQEA